jgi:hypothetical protein
MSLFSKLFGASRPNQPAPRSTALSFDLLEGRALPSASPVTLSPVVIDVTAYVGSPTSESANVNLGALKALLTADEKPFLNQLESALANDASLTAGAKAFLNQLESALKDDSPGAFDVLGTATSNTNLELVVLLSPNLLENSQGKSPNADVNVYQVEIDIMPHGAPAIQFNSSGSAPRQWSVVEISDAAGSNSADTPFQQLLAAESAERHTNPDLNVNTHMPHLHVDFTFRQTTDNWGGASDSTQGQWSIFGS